MSKHTSSMMSWTVLSELSFLPIPVSAKIKALYKVTDVTTKMATECCLNISFILDCGFVLAVSATLAAVLSSD